jgi:hypothetical protein
MTNCLLAEITLLNDSAAGFTASLLKLATFASGRIS